MGVCRPCFVFHWPGMSGAVTVCSTVTKEKCLQSARWPKLQHASACAYTCCCLCWWSASRIGLGPRHSTGYPGHQRPVRPPLPPLPTAGAVWWNVHRERGASQHYGVRGRCCDCQASTGEVSVEPTARPYARAIVTSARCSWLPHALWLHPVHVSLIKLCACGWLCHLPLPWVADCWGALQVCGGQHGRPCLQPRTGAALVPLAGALCGPR
jgi:hypothetical protein